MTEAREFQLAVAQGRTPCAGCPEPIRPAEPHLAIQHRYRTQHGYSTWSIRLHPCCARMWLARQVRILESLSTPLGHRSKCSRCELAGP
ncbi:MAG: hypothetical protein LC620_09000 [Halobacteriales archaeon]|nr:hypothetical protein [Halobacteriales archaeon]